jgi:hypothetical protein
MLINISRKNILKIIISLFCSLIFFTGLFQLTMAADSLPIQPRTDNSTVIMRPVDMKKVVQARTAAAEALAAQNKTKFSIKDFLTEYWVQFWALLVSAIGVILAISGFSFANRKKKKSTSKYLKQIDETFSSFKWKSKRCEAELYRMHDIIDDDLKAGKMDDRLYELLTKRIHKYIDEIKDIENYQKPTTPSN